MIGNYLTVVGCKVVVDVLSHVLSCHTFYLNGVGYKVIVNVFSVIISERSGKQKEATVLVAFRRF